MISAVKDNPYTLFEISPTIRGGHLLTAQGISDKHKIVVSN
jgi:hypothetical protein